MSEQLTSNLHPCPFCRAHPDGGVVRIERSKFQNYVGSFYVQCDCTLGGCGAAGGFRIEEQEAIDAWNRRTALPPPASRAEVTDVAISVSRLIHNCCKDVPHDIGLRVVKLIERMDRAAVTKSGEQRYRDHVEMEKASRVLPVEAADSPAVVAESPGLEPIYVAGPGTPIIGHRKR